MNQQGESGRSSPENRSGTRVGSEVVEYADAPDECTLFPLTVSSRDERMTAWMTARGDAFVDLVEVR